MTSPAYSSRSFNMSPLRFVSSYSGGLGWLLGWVLVVWFDLIWLYRLLLPACVSLLACLICCGFI